MAGSTSLRFYQWSRDYKILPSKILENRDGSRKRPFVNPVTTKYQHMQRELWRQEVQKNLSPASGEETSSREWNVKKWMLSINSTSDMLMKDDIDNLTVLAALSRQESFQKSLRCNIFAGRFKRNFGVKLRSSRKN